MNNIKFSQAVEMLCESITLQLDCVSSLLNEEDANQLDINVFSVLVGCICENSGADHVEFLEQIRKNIDEVGPQETAEEMAEDAKRFIS